MNKSLSFIKNSCLLFFILISLTAFSQEKTNAIENEKGGEVETISIDKISEESEQVNQRIHNYKSILVPSATVKELDSILDQVQEVILLEKDSLISDFEDISKRELKNREVEWQKYRSELKKYQAELNERTVEVNKLNNEILKEISRWEDTKENLSKNNNSTTVTSSLDNIITTLNEVLKSATSRLDAIYIIEKKLTELVLITDDVIAQISAVELELQKDYFVFDSPPIWSSKTDSVKVKPETEEALSFSEKLIENKKLVTTFFEDNAKIAAFQLLFILLIFFLLLAVKRKWIIKLNELTNPVEIQAKIVLRNYIAATVSVGLLISLFFYDALIPNVSELFIFLILLGTLSLLPKLTNDRIRIYLIVLFGIYILNIFGSYLESNLLANRYILLFETLVLAWAFVHARKLMNRNPTDFTRIHRVFIVITPVYIILLIIAGVANVIGMLALAHFVFNGVLVSALLMMVLYLSVKVITSLVVLTFKLRKKYEMQTVSTIVNATHKRFQPILFWTGMLIWFYFSLRGFEVLDFIQDWVNDTLLITWEVGETTISLGGILSFTFIISVTLLFSKLASSIFQDEWMINILPRGVAPAISLILRIAFICIGFYIGLTSVGIELDKLGFIIGALGVGIGFGLQNVVLNFIAGLILAFERPINLGDAIQVDSEFGVVTSIGVRSSNIKTYSGYEAIIPNGDLISKKVVNWTLSNRDRRSKKEIKTAPNVDPNDMIALFLEIASKHPKTFKDPEPRVFFKGYEPEGNLLFELWYWSTFSETLTIDHEVQLEIFDKLKELNIQAPVPARRIIKE